MHVKSLQLKNFMVHESLHVDLPSKGLVVVQGRNGVGKSSLVEAVSVAFWGKSLRGSSPWRGGCSGSAYVVADGIEAERSIHKNKKSVQWRTSEKEKWRTYDTESKAQEALTVEVGEWDLWRRTHVFSSQDASHFTLASDAERKRLLERLLQLDIFEEGYVRARVDFKDLEAKLFDAERELDRARIRREAAEEQLLQSQQEPIEERPEEPQKPADLGDLDKKIVLLEEEMNQLQEKLSSIDADISAYNSYIDKLSHSREVLRQRELLASQQKCPTCERVMDQKWCSDWVLDIERTRKEFDSDLVSVEAELKKSVEDRKKYYNKLQKELKPHLSDLIQQKASSERDAVLFKHWGKQLEAWEKRKGQRKEREKALWERLDSLVSVCNEADEAVTSLKKEVNLQRAVCSVLSTKGVRAHVLGKCLGWVEETANAWLACIAGEDLRVALKAYSEKKSGGISEAISMEISGAGGGHGYKASSGGERRRIDAALLLALAEVASVGAGQGTIWVDEVFDALDDEGVVAICDALQELASNRAVVVITHNQSLVEMLRPVKVINMEGDV